MSQAIANRATYLSALLEQATAAAERSGLALDDLRSTAQALVSERSFPSGREEEWRFTDLREMLSNPFQSAVLPTDLEGLRPTVEKLTLPEAKQRIVLVNGHYADSLSELDAGGEIAIALLSQLIETDRDRILKHLARIQGSNEVFTALNTAGFADATVIQAGSSQAEIAPVQIIYLSLPGSTPVIAQPRCLVLAAANSRLSLVETYWGNAETPYFTNSVTEFWLEANAQVEHTRIQQEGAETFHIAKTAVSQGRDSRYTSTAIDLGAKLSRHHLEVYQTGPQTDTRLYGLSALQSAQLADTHSLIALSQPYGTADQVQKNVISDRAHAVFNGKVFVPREAQLTNAAQLNRNLLLSNQARVDTKPELEIIANDVKCAHGATVSQLEADEVFYLESRGIRADQAQRLLVYAFAAEVIEKISLPSLRESLSQHVTDWIH
ncbi:Fe-S cluster assembly protein SufD [Romeria aff. gracilis LEGE 07310]|uniref:Fe-S cluster assembly protein SufD n=1 Tax=Vasconcelosia minhoensis LEGE 07310 TaxID=915328 RepID=A0A8J7A579_9CYAN|nr:Fe-S cluster assembly protein SufD [Romeria gracilis]MBE9076195.1 Fe-S cluster assembly protein SufD [Romeria aff. gracilis LEGE 07310]